MLFVLIHFHSLPPHSPHAFVFPFSSKSQSKSIKPIHTNSYLYISSPIDLGFHCCLYRLALFEDPILDFLSSLGSRSEPRTDGGIRLLDGDFELVALSSLLPLSAERFL